MNNRERAAVERPPSPPTAKRQAKRAGSAWAVAAMGVCALAVLALAANAASGHAGPATGRGRPIAAVTPCPPTWVERAPLPRGVMGASAAELGGKIYLFGGRDYTYTNLDTAHRYEPGPDAWVALAPMPAVRNWASAASLGGYIYVINGSDGGGPNDTVFRFDPATNSWLVMPPTTRASYGATAVAFNGALYKVGGLEDPGGFSRDVEVLGVGFTAPMPEGKAWAPAVALGGYLYVAGGNTDTGLSLKTYRYDPAANTWSDDAIADLPEPKGFSAFGVLDGRFVIAGGGDDYGSVLAWDPITNVWANLPPLAQPRFNLTGGVASGAFYALGGINDNLPDHTNQVYLPASCSTATATATAQATHTPSPTPTLCVLPTVPDLPPGSPFEPYARCLICQGIMTLYACGGAPGEPCGGAQNWAYFRPNASSTRGQLSKVVSLAAGFSEPVGGQAFEDVPPGHTFYTYTERIAARQLVSGYPCGAAGEPCVPPLNRPYFRPGATTTRGQLAKLVSNAAGLSDPPVGQTFEDVPPGHTFYTYTERLSSRAIMQGYQCGNPEPCVPPLNRPYFRPGSNVTRGQTAKIVANTFFPGCVP